MKCFTGDGGILIHEKQYQVLSQESARGSLVGQNGKRENKPRGQSLSVAKTRQNK